MTFLAPCCPVTNSILSSSMWTTIAIHCTPLALHNYNIALDLVAAPMLITSSFIPLPRSV